MKKMAAIALAVGLALALSTGMIHAQDDNAVAVVITGTNYCVPCALKEQGATAECGDTCNQFAIKVTDIRDADGNYVRGFVNKTVFYLANAKGAEITGNQELKDKTLSIEGSLFKDERVIDVKTFKQVEGGPGTGVVMSGQVGAPPAAGASSDAQK